VLFVAVALLMLGREELVVDITGSYRWVVYGLGFVLAGGFHRSRLVVVAPVLGPHAVMKRIEAKTKQPLALTR